MKKDYIFNTLAGLINAAESIIICMIITRKSDLSDAGYVTLAFAISNLLLSIGKYGTYNFRVTDHYGEYSFSVYFRTRLITTFAMIVCIAVYLCYGMVSLRYGFQKTIIILFICLINVVESVENIVRAQLQYAGYLYIAAIMFIIRWISIFITFGITMSVTKNTCFALGMSLLVSLLVFILCYFSFRKYLQIPTAYETPSKKCSDLLSACFPLFITMFLSFYIVNSPKYALDKFMDSSAQACFGFISMPVFAIQLMNELIYQPQLVSLTAEFNESRISQFRKHVMLQYLIILMLTAISLTAAYFIGIPFLSWLYNTDLGSYSAELLILLLGGGFLALSGYQGSILTLIRRQKYQLYGYIPVSVIALLFVGHIVKKHGTIGAALSYLVLIVILCLLYEVFIGCSLKKHPKT